jgi:hypothetical protein
MSKNLNQVYTTNPITVNAGTDLMYFMQSPYSAGTDAGMTFSSFKAQFGNPYTPAALTEVNDTNVTLALGGSPSTALLAGVSITAGWIGTLSPTRGGTGQGSFTPYAVITGGTTGTGNLQQVASLGASGQVLTSSGAGSLPVWASPATPSGVVLLSPTADQTITAHNLIVAGGNISAGSSGAAGTLRSYPSISSRGSLVVSAYPNAADVTTTITNASMAQASVITIPDPASPTADFCIAPNGFVDGNLVVASGTIGLLVDSGYAPSQGYTVVNQLSSNTLTPFTINLTHGGATLVTYTLPSSVNEGDTYIIIGTSSGGWKVNTSGGSQVFHVSPQSANTSIASTSAFDCVTITVGPLNLGVQPFVCYSIQGNLTLV